MDTYIFKQMSSNFDIPGTIWIIKYNAGNKDILFCHILFILCGWGTSHIKDYVSFDVYYKLKQILMTANNWEYIDKWDISRESTRKFFFRTWYLNLSCAGMRELSQTEEQHCWRLKMSFRKKRRLLWLHIVLKNWPCSF